MASDDSVPQQTQDATETYWTCSGTTGYHVPPDGHFYTTSLGASLDGDYRGTCVSKSSAPNDHCSSLPGMKARELPRLIGDSSASASTATACVPDWLP